MGVGPTCGVDLGFLCFGEMCGDVSELSSKY